MTNEILINALRALEFVVRFSICSHVLFPYKKLKLILMTSNREWKRNETPGAQHK